MRVGSLVYQSVIIAARSSNNTDGALPVLARRAGRVIVTLISVFIFLSIGFKLLATTLEQSINLILFLELYDPRNLDILTSSPLVDAAKPQPLISRRVR